jgi:hypothetical protein
LLARPLAYRRKDCLILGEPRCTVHERESCRTPGDGCRVRRASRRTLGDATCTSYPSIGVHRVAIPESGGAPRLIPMCWHRASGRWSPR